MAIICKCLMRNFLNLFRWTMSGKADKNISLNQVFLRSFGQIYADYFN